MVRYEDLVDNTLKELEEIYSWMGVAFTPSVEKFAFEMTHDAKSNEQGYFSLSRGSAFSHDSWKKELTKEDVEAVEVACKEVMSDLRYPAWFHPPTWIK